MVFFKKVLCFLHRNGLVLLFAWLGVDERGSDSYIGRDLFFSGKRFKFVQAQF